jgi:hypothetical protein
LAVSKEVTGRKSAVEIRAMRRKKIIPGEKRIEKVP